MSLDNGRCGRGHWVERYAHPAAAGPHERLNLYIAKDGTRACLDCTRAQWRAQYRRKTQRKEQQA